MYAFYLSETIKLHTQLKVQLFWKYSERQHKFV